MKIRHNGITRKILNVLIIITMLATSLSTALPAYAETSESVSIKVSQDNYVNVVLTVGDSTKNANSFEGELRTALEALEFPMDRLDIQAIETATTSTTDSDAEEIFDSWANYPDSSGNWLFTPAVGDEPASIGSTQNVSWTGYWDDSVDAQNTKDVSISYYSTENFRVRGVTPKINYTTSEYSGHPDPQGYTFRMTKDPDTGLYSYYAFWIYSYQQVAALYKIVDVSNPNNARDISNGPLNCFSRTIDGSKVGQTGTYTTFMAFADIDYNPLADHHITIDAKGNNIKINYDEAPLFDVTDEADPLLQGSYGPYTYSMPNGKFFNMGITTESSKRFSEVIREPEWLDGSKRFIVNLEDGEVDDFKDPTALGEILARLGNDEIYYIGWGTDTNESQAKDFIAKNDNRGTFVNNTSSTSIDQIAQYIYDEYAGSIIDDTDYVLYGKPSTITVNPIEAKTNTTDDIWIEGKWRVEHDPDYYKNPTGSVPYDGLQLDSLDITLNQTGKYDIYYKTDLIRTIYVHRMPVASYDASVSDNSITITDNSRDYDVENIGDKGIASRSYFWKNTDATTWTAGEPITIAEKGNYLIKLIVTDSLRAESLPAYKYVSVNQTSTELEALEPIAEFNLMPSYVYLYDDETDPVVTLYNTSYDPAGRSITQSTWTVTKDGTDQLMDPDTSGILDFTGKDAGTYKISLQVKNSDNILSETVSRYVIVVDDKIAPSATCDKVAGTYYETTNINLTFSDEGDSGFSRRFVVIDNSSSDPADWGSMGTNRTLSFDLDIPGPDKVYIHYKLLDNAGNETTGNFGPFTLTDNQNPSIPSVNMTSGEDLYTSGNWTDGDVVVEINGATDNFTTSENMVYYYSTNGTDYTSGSTLTLIAEGTHNLYAKAKDETGNYSSPTMVTVKIDKTNPSDPTITLKDNNGGDYSRGTWYGGNSVTLSLSGSTDTSGVTYQYKFDDGDWTEGATKTFTDEGIYLISCKAVDGSGRDSNEKNTVIKIDRTAPAISSAINKDKVDLVFANTAGSEDIIEISELSGFTVVNTDTNESPFYDWTSEILIDESSLTASVSMTETGYMHIFARDLVGNTGHTYIKIDQLETAVTAPVATEVEYGKSLGQISFTGGTASFNGKVVTGTFSWVDATHIPDVDNSLYSLAFTPVDDLYKTVYINVPVSLTKATPQISLSDTTASYTGNPINITAALVTGVEGASAPTGNITYIYYTDIACSILTTPGNSGALSNGSAPVYAGKYYSKATIAESMNYVQATTSALPGTLTITATSVVVDPSFSIGSDLTKTYGDESFILNSSGGSGLGEVTFTSSNPSVASVSADGYVTINSAGSAEITATKASDGNHDAQYADITITVNKKDVTYTLANTSKVYTGATQYASVTPSISRLVAGFDYSVKYYKSTDSDNTTPCSPIETGDYKIVVTTINDNYEGTVEGLSILTISNSDQVSALEIGGLPGYVEYQDTFGLYANGGNGDGDITWEVTDGSDYAEVNYTSGAVSITGVGSVTITATKAAEGSYDQQTSEVTFLASKKNISYTITNNDYTYDNSSKSLTVTPSVAGFMGYTVTGNEQTNAGEYSVTVTTDDDTNYKGSETAKLTINKADLEVSLSQENGIYGQVIKDPVVAGDFNSVEITYEGYRIVDEVENKPTNAGEYTVIARFEGDANHNDALVKYNFTIAKKKLTVTTDNQSRKYMEENPVLTVTYNGFATGDSSSNLYIEPQVTTTATKDSDVGPYDITVNGGVSTNYEFDYVNTGKLTIVQTSQNIPLYITNAPNTTTFGDEFILYANGGSSSSSLVWESSDISIATIDNDGNVKIVGVGQVAFTAVKEADANFQAQTESVTIEAVKKPITYAVTNTYQTYDGESKSVTVTPGVAGFTGYTVTGNEKTNAGIYDIRVTTDDPNYQGSETAKLVINKADSSASVVQGDITYGTELDPTLAFTYGSCQVTYMGTSIPWETINKPVKPGTYTVIARVTGDANHDDSIATDTFIIDKKMLTVTAVDNTKNYNEENPTFALTYEGFVYGDDESNLYIKPKGTTEASKTSEAGEYDIAPMGGIDTNYDFTYVNGKLEILGIGQTTSLYITNAPSDSSASYKDEFKLYANGGDGTGNITWSSSDNDIATIDSTGLVKIVGVGKVIFTATKASDANFEEQTETVTITAYPKAIEVTAVAKDRPYKVGDKDVEVKLIAEIDGVTASAISATVSTANAGLDKIVTIEGVSINNVNYKPESTTIYTTVDITSVDDTSLAITGIPADTTYEDEGYQLSTTGGSGTGDVTFTSSNSNVATISPQGYVTVKGSGTTEITATKASDVNYDQQSDSKTITVDKKEINFGISGTDKVYTGEAIYATVSPSDPSLREGIDYSVTYSPVSDPVEKGIYTIEVRIINDNYKLKDTGTDTGSLLIRSADQQAFALTGLPSVDIEYTDTFILTANGGSGSGDVTYASDNTSIAAITSTGAVEVKGVGQVTITATKAADDNFKAQSSQVTFTAVAKEIEVTASAEGRKFIAGDKSVTVKLSTVVEGLEASYESATMITEAAGNEKQVIVRGVAIDDENYTPADTIIFTTVDISSIDESKLVISGLPSSIIYGDADFVLEATSAGTGNVIWESNSTSAAIVGGDTGNVEIRGAGEVTIRATRESDGNYNETTNTVTFTVKQKPAIYAITGNTVSYTGQVQYATIIPAEAMTEGLDYEVIYGQDGEQVEETVDAGIYDITVNTLNENYSGISTGAAFTIQASDQTYKLELGGLPSYIAYEDEFALYANGGNGEGSITWQVTSGTSIAAISDSGLVEVTGVGNATITATKEADSNHNAKSISVTFATNKKEISAAISNTHKEYNGEIQSISLAGTSVKYNTLSDIVGVKYEMQDAGSHEELRDVGKYNVYLSIKEEYESLYRLSGINTGFAEMTKKQLIITADNKSKTYGDENPDLTMSYDLSGTDETINEPSIICEADESFNVGSYVIELAYDENHGNKNYDIVLVNGSLNIEKAQLKVTANDKDIEYMDAEPPYTVRYEGFIEGEDSSVLSGQLVMDCSYKKGEDIGVYLVSPSGLLSDNYKISYEAGTLNVESMPVAIMASGYTDYMTLRLSKAVSGISLDNIIISGEVDKERIREYYNGAKYVVYTELAEGESYQLTIDLGDNYSFNTVEFEAEKRKTSSGGSSSTGTHVPVKEEPEVTEEPEVQEPTEGQHWAKKKSDKLEEAFGIREVFGLLEESEEETEEESGTEDDSNSSDGMNYERGITRGEIAGVMCRILGIVDSEIQEDNTFDDLDESHKLYKDMLLAVEYGIFEGYGDGTFKPDQVISREEMAAVIYRSMIKVMELAEASDDLSYNDKEKIKFWAQEQVAILTELGIFEGYDDGEFKPENTIKVGEAITALYRMAEYMEYIN